MRAVVCPLAAVAGLALAGCADSHAPARTASRPLGPLPSDPGPCRPTRPPRPRVEGHLHRPSLLVDRGARYVATIRTPCGPITVLLAAREQPRTVASFVFLARHGFYDGLSFDRVIREPGGGPFVVAGGEPLGTARGGPGYDVVEPPPDGTEYVRGTVAMFRRVHQSRGSSGSQLFIVTAPRLKLPPDYAVLGHVVAGARALARIARRPSDPQTGLMRDPVPIERLTVRGP